jgi:hypothetical protein
MSESRLFKERVAEVKSDVGERSSLRLLLHCLPVSMQFEIIKGTPVHRAFCFGFWCVGVVGFVLGAVVVGLLERFL